MKIKATFLLACLCSLFTTAFAQSRFPGAADSARWFVDVLTVGGPHGEVFSYLRDSTISGNSYQLYSRSYIFSGNLNFNSVPVFIVRSSGAQVFAWEGSSDRLLYDFDIQIGDTLATLSNAQVNIPLSLRTFRALKDSVIQLSSGPARLIRMGYREYPDTTLRKIDWIEGVGTKTHPFICQDHIVCPDWYASSCLKTSGNLHRFAPAGHTNCQNQLFIDGVEELQEGHVDLFPNPMTGSAAFSLHGVPAREAQLEVFNLLSQRVETKSLWLSNGAGQVEIGAELPAGIYVVSLTVNGQTSKLKLEKQ
jgi:hypothetical protein